MIAWNDTTEARRAIADALPLLTQAKHVCVATVTSEADIGDAREKLAEIVLWLARHGITAHAIASPSSGDDATRLDHIADDEAADTIVAGGYGHSRVREWIMGGVTRTLLHHPTRCAFLSH